MKTSTQIKKQPKKRTKKDNYDIAIFLNSKSGETGNLTYELAIIEKILNSKSNNTKRIIIAVKDIRILHDYGKELKKKKIKVQEYRINTITGLLILINHFKVVRKYIHKMKLNIIENKFNANMYYFTSPNELALAISNPKLITTFWDFGHKQLHRDPDTSTITSRLKRNYYYKNAINRSSKIITDSKSTSKLISKYYSFPNKRIIIVGLPVPKSIKLATRKDIISLTKDMKYIIYPATNWDHKNHNFLLKVFVKLIDKEPNLKLVLCGTRVKQKTSLEELISKYGLEKNVIDLGYLNKPYVNYLIKKSVLLVMPTKLGPTNYPVFESAALGKRSVISQVHEKEAIKEIVNYVTIVQGWNPNKWVSLIRRDMKKRISNNPLRVKNEKIDHLLSSAIFTNHNI